LFSAMLDRAFLARAVPSDAGIVTNPFDACLSNTEACGEVHKG
jgi:hypothetical protein